jgi:hypothetical protein
MPLLLPPLLGKLPSYNRKREFGLRPGMSSMPQLQAVAMNEVPAVNQHTRGDNVSFPFLSGAAGGPMIAAKLQ